MLYNKCMPVSFSQDDTQTIASAIDDARRVGNHWQADRLTEVFNKIVSFNLENHGELLSSAETHHQGVEYKDGINVFPTQQQTIKTDTKQEIKDPFKVLSELGVVDHIQSNNTQQSESHQKIDSKESIESDPLEMLLQAKRKEIENVSKNPAQTISEKVDTNIPPIPVESTLSQHENIEEDPITSRIKMLEALIADSEKTTDDQSQLPHENNVLEENVTIIKQNEPPHQSDEHFLIAYPDTIHNQIIEILTRSAEQTQTPRSVLEPVFFNELTNLIAEKIEEEPLLERLPRDASLRSILTRFDEELISRVTAKII